ncbi:MAG: DUF916 domain-containing protein [Patescibacteria group bacterium]
MNVKFVGVLALALAVLLSLLVSPHTFAQSSTSNSANTIKVTPVRSDIQIMPGANQTVQVTVSNLTDSPISVTPVTNDFVAGDDRGTPALILDADKFAPSHSLKRFMAPLSTATIPAREAKTFNVVITVPSDAKAGGYFGAIRFAPSDPDGGGQVNLSASVASLILLTVPGDIVEKLQLESFEIQQNGANGTSFRTPDNIQAAFSFENLGNLQMGPFGHISVKQGDKVVYETNFNDQNPRDVILPDSSRRWEVPLENIGTFGKYDVIATFTYGTTNQTIEVTKSFWVIPQWVIITAIAIIVLLVLAIALTIWLIIRSRKKRHMPKMRRR